VVGIVGLRQVGKTTLAREMMARFRGKTQRFDLEDPSDEARLADAKLALGGLRFWTMLANYHGQIWNASEFGRAFGISDITVRRYLDTRAATFVVRVLQPWHENIGKRQVKAPKVFISDSGILHVLLGIETAHRLDGHVKVGASWEGFAMDAVIRHLGARREQCFFWATHAGAELDLLVVRAGQRLGFEFKRSSAPRLTPSMRSAMSDLRLTRLDVVYPGTETFPLAEHVRAVPLQAFVGKG